jgi:glycosyltransferase involved in cell wall biosynthesis
MRIIFATHDGVTLHRGGPFVKITNTKKSLEALGIEVRYFDLWNVAREFRTCDLVHLFGANFAVYNLARNMMVEKVKFVVNPIFYTRRSSRVVQAITTIDKLTRRVMRGIWWDYGFTRDICNWAEMVLPNTVAEGEIISRGMGIPKEKFTVIHNGVSGEFINADPTLFKKKYGLENFILTVGHMGPDRKNVFRLVQALGKIDHPAVFIGRKWYMGETEQILQEAERNKNLLIIDELPNDSPLLASAYAASDVFALPSKFETPSRAALEAALAGAKVVITPHGGTKDYFADLAEYVDPYSVNSIQRGIERALNQPKSSALREHIKNNFLWDKIARDTLEVYQKVLSKTNSTFEGG